MMERLRTGCSFRCNILLSTSVFVILQIVLCEAQVVFGPDDPSNNEVIYFGEDVAFRCEVLGVSSDESVEFSISKGGKALIANNSILSVGNITDIQVSDSLIRFTLKTFASTNGDYECRAISTREDYGTKVYKLELQQQDTVHCRRNVKYMYISMEVVLLSCYFTPSENKIVRWFKNDTNGVRELTSTKVEVNDLKHRVLSVIQPSNELSLSNYFCEENQMGSTGTMTEPTGNCDGGSFLVYDGPFIFITPNLSSIPAESFTNFTCNVITLPNTDSQSFWQPPLRTTLPVGVNATPYDSSFLGIHVLAEAEVGATINLTCNAFIGLMPSSSDFSVVIEANEPTNSTTQKPNDDSTSSRNNTGQNNNNNNINNDNNNNDIIIVIVIVSLVAIVIISCFILVVCFCLCRKKEDSESFQEDDDETEAPVKVDESSSIPQYGVVNKKNRDKSGDENETDATMKEDDNGEVDYNLVNPPTNSNDSSTGLSVHLSDQSHDGGKGYTGVTVKSPNDDRPATVSYTPVVKKS